MHSIGDEIRKLRKRHYKTQGDLAAYVGVSVQAVSKWECGGAPDIELLPQIADFFNVSIDRLFGRSVDPEATVEEAVMRSIEQSPGSHPMKKTKDIVWAAFKSLTSLPGIQPLDYADEGSGDKACTRCCVLFDEGISYVSADRSEFSFFLMPEPEHGYLKALASPKAYRDFFAFLAQPSLMELLFFLYEQNERPFSMRYASKSLGIDAQTTQTLLQSLVDRAWLNQEFVELDSGAKEIFRPLRPIPGLAMLYYASELQRNTKLWYLSHDKRKLPFLVREEQEV